MKSNFNWYFLRDICKQSCRKTWFEIRTLTVIFLLFNEFKPVGRIVLLVRFGLQLNLIQNQHLDRKNHKWILVRNNYFPKIRIYSIRKSRLHLLVSETSQSAQHGPSKMLVLKTLIIRFSKKAETISHEEVSIAAEAEQSTPYRFIWVSHSQTQTRIDYIFIFDGQCTNCWNEFKLL